jgi:hypothetical protein
MRTRIALYASEVVGENEWGLWEYGAEHDPWLNTCIAVYLYSIGFTYSQANTKSSRARSIS